MGASLNDMILETIKLALLMRNNTLDFAKFFASFFVIVVHSGSYPEMSPANADLFRAASRWAVPFFFLASGYLMGGVGNIDVGKKLNKLFGILFYSSLLYVPIIYLSTNSDITTLFIRVFSFDTLRSGTFFHLWFITALMSGVMLTNYMIKNVKTATGLVIALLLLAGYWLSDIGQAFNIPAERNYMFYVFRSLLGIPLVYMGYLLAKEGLLSKISNTMAWSLFIAGIMLMMLEVPLCQWFIEGYARERQFPLFSVPVAVALLAICANTATKENLISRAGRDFSLGIYLIHPFLLYFIVPWLESKGVKVSTVNLVSAFILSWFIFAIMKKWLPALYGKFNGAGIK